VTAATLAEATEIAATVAAGRKWAFDPRLVEQNVDVRALDAGEVLPYLGDAARPGVWFPPPAR
jgi:hypothetical protein